MNDEHVQEIMNIISHSGLAKGLMFQALSAIKEGNNDEADKNMKQADEELVISHQAQTNLLFYDAEHNDLNVTLLMVHAADHLSSAETTRDFINVIIEIFKGGKHE